VWVALTGRSGNAVSLTLDTTRGFRLYRQTGDIGEERDGYKALCAIKTRDFPENEGGGIHVAANIEKIKV
jgi:hypothetical protein